VSESDSDTVVLESTSSKSLIVSDSMETGFQRVFTRETTGPAHSISCNKWVYGQMAAAIRGLDNCRL